jgi:hypothetical protein
MRSDPLPKEDFLLPRPKANSATSFDYKRLREMVADRARAEGVPQEVILKDAGVSRQMLHLTQNNHPQMPVENSIIKLFNYFNLKTTEIRALFIPTPPQEEID